MTDPAAQLAEGLLIDARNAASGTAAPDLDWGIPLLTVLAGAHLADPSQVRAAALEWAIGQGRPSRHAGVFGGGLPARTIGLAHAAAVEPRLAGVARRAVERMADLATAVDRRRSAVLFDDYDIVSGAAGISLTLAASPWCPRSQLVELTGYLTELCDAELDRFRLGDAGPPDLTWNVGLVNLGLAHGATGVLAALIATLPHLGGEHRTPALRAIRRVCDFLVAHVRQDRHGATSWPMTDGTDVSQPPTESYLQAWCYGTPGVAWQLAEAGRVLGDRELREFGRAAMASLATAWTDDRYLGATPTGRYAFCHGAAGVLAVADAFAIHTDLAPARQLADHLAALLVAALPTIADGAMTDRTFLNGAPGVAAVLLSRSAARRSWLRVVGLR
jgi:lantibiotic biosynthesis protein